MPRIRSPALLLLAAAAMLLLSACGEKGEPALEEIGPPPGGTLTVVVEPRVVAPGGSLQASVRNETAAQFTYGADYTLERRRPGGGFERVQLPDRPVIQIALIAEPGEVGPPVRVRVPPGAEPGVWRVVIQRDLPDVGDLAGEFRVVRNG